MAQQAQFQTQRFTTLDLVVIAVLGVVFGILNTPFGVVFQFIQATLGPIGQSLFSPWAISMVLTLYIVRKPGAGFLNGLVNGLFQVLSGNPAGLVNLGWGFALGLGAEVGVALDQYFSGSRRFNWITALLAGAVANMFSFAVTAIAFNYLSAGLDILLVGWVAQVAAGSVESGLIALLLGQLLAQSGLLKSFAAGRQRATPPAAASG